MDRTPISMQFVYTTTHPAVPRAHPSLVQIFDIGDFYENSALDMEDAEQSGPAEMLQRRRSSAVSRRRPSHTHTQSATSTPPRSTISLSAKSERPSGPSAIPLPRARLNSIVTRGIGGDPAQAVASPLAQVFQPLIVDDDREGEADQLSQDGVGGAMVSYGPASRRRLSSMARRPTALVHGDFFGGGAAGGQAGLPRRSPGQVTMTSPGARPGITGQALSTSPETRETTRSPEKERVLGQGPSHLHEPLETATEEQEEQEEGGASPTDRRLEEIERRQQRIEELLERLVARAQ